MLRFAAVVALAIAQTNTASGGVCERGRECLKTEYCNFFNECQPRKNEGEYCTGDQPGDQLCFANLTCDQRDHMCVLPVPKCANDTACQSGEYCDSQGTKTCFPVACGSDVQCSPRYFCRIAAGARIGACTKQAEQGEPCGSSYPCSQGLRCQAGACEGVPTPAVSPTPANRIRAIGSSCTRELDCEIGLYCKNGDPRYKDTGNCSRWSQEGQQCDEATLCVQGQFCVVQVNYGDSGLCIPYQEKGYAKVRPGSTRWMAEGRPLARTPPDFGMVDAGSIPVYASGPRPYVTLAPSSPPSAKVLPKDVPATPPVSTSTPFATNPSFLNFGPLPATSVPLSSATSVPLSPSFPFAFPQQIAPQQFGLPMFPATADRRAGADTVCCEAMTATCLSCQLQVSVSAFCAGNPTISGCNGLTPPASQTAVLNPAGAPLASSGFSSTFAMAGFPAFQAQPVYTPQFNTQPVAFQPTFTSQFSQPLVLQPTQPQFQFPQFPQFQSSPPQFIQSQPQFIPSSQIYPAPLPLQSRPASVAMSQSWPG